MRRAIGWPARRSGYPAFFAARALPPPPPFLRAKKRLASLSAMASGNATALGSFALSATSIGAGQAEDSVGWTYTLDPLLNAAGPIRRRR